ncbi:MAG: Holliday junction branch migration protein RuvA [Candidatus Doudnabacteria bacterium]|nr:Holliday junction branch migration protein RuvA [Candidatus Doudnabacteria bacterium]
MPLALFFVNAQAFGYNATMIGSITGQVQHKGAGYLIVDAHGVGYKVFVIPALLLKVKVGQELSLVISTYVREDQISLYGFEILPELEFFELLLTVSGIGPKSALGIMSLASLEMIKSAIVSEDPSVFTKVSGIGTKTAERVIVELKGKLREEKDAAPVAREHSEALDALLALGYTQQQAREALKAVPAEVTKLQEKVKLALKSLGK